MFNLKLFKSEMKKVFHNGRFITVVIIGTVIAVITALYVINRWDQNLIRTEKTNSLTHLTGNMKNPSYQMYGAFTNWMGQEISSATAALFYLLIPIFATLSYGWSYQSELKSGYIKNVLVKVDKKGYYLTKYLATFLGGGLAVIIPMLINIMIVFMYLPAIKPDPCYDMNYGVFGGQFASDLFYETPVLYILLKLVFTFIFAGLIATSSIAFTFFVNNKFAVVIVPFIVVLTFHYFAMNFLIALVARLGLSNVLVELSPILYLHASTNHVNPWVIIIEYLILFAFSFGVTMHKGIKNDVF